MLKRWPAEGGEVARNNSGLPIAVCETHLKDPTMRNRASAPGNENKKAD